MRQGGEVLATVYLDRRAFACALLTAVFAPLSLRLYRTR